jgi:hypothetical protein
MTKQPYDFRRLLDVKPRPQPRLPETVVNHIAERFSRAKQMNEAERKLRAIEARKRDAQVQRLIAEYCGLRAKTPHETMIIAIAYILTGALPWDAK